MKCNNVIFSEIEMKEKFLHAQNLYLLTFNCYSQKPKDLWLKVVLYCFSKKYLQLD